MSNDNTRVREAGAYHCVVPVDGTARWASSHRRASFAGRVTASALGAVLLGALLGACANSAASPTRSVRSYLSAWARRDWSEMRALTEHPPADFVRVNSAALADLDVSRARYTAGVAAVHGSRATVPVSEALTIARIGTLSLRTRLRLVARDGSWLVDWSPATIAPQLRTGDHLVLTTAFPPRAPILGQGGVPLTTETQIVEIGLEGRYITDPNSLATSLVAAGAPQPAVANAIALARAHPTWFEPVFAVSRARYEQLKPTLYPLPGTVFQATAMRTAITPGLEAHVVGSVGPITAQELQEFGAPYDASSIVGQTGLEQYDQAQLAGSPGATVTVANANNTTLAVVGSIKAKPGRALRTTIDPSVQRAAEAALAGQTRHAAMVVVNPRNGAILASVSDPTSDGFDQALDGTFPPGSTFKIVTASALIARGLSPSSAASCPQTITVEGEVFHNAPGEIPVRHLLQAFAESRNTAFIGLATRDLTADELVAAARLFGIGRSDDPGYPVFSGSVPTPGNEAALAATAIGQAKVVVSPLDLAMVAAAVDSGVLRSPRLVAGAPDDRAAATRLPPSLVSDLRTMMAAVVASGTAAHTGLPPGTYAKTGTAEVGSGAALSTDAWLVGFRGDLAFAVVVVNGGYGGPNDGPIIAKFLDAVGSARG